MSRPSFTLLLAVLAAAVDFGAPVPPPKPLTTDLAELSRRTHSKDEATRELAVGLLLPHLKSGMTRDQVEKLIGPPHVPVDDDVAEMEASEDVTYYTREAGKPGFQVMSVRYDTRKRPWKFAKVIGPHKMHDCG